MPSIDKEVLEKSFVKTGAALDRLGELVAMLEGSNSLLLDATLQRFEFCFESLWKLFRKVHIVRGETTRRPYEAIKEAGAAGWLGNRETWQQMIDDRNVSVHTYNKADAEAIFKRIRENFYPEMRHAYQTVHTEFYPR